MNENSWKQLNKFNEINENYEVLGIEKMYIKWKSWMIKIWNKIF